MKKNYKGFCLWILIFLITMFGAAFLPIEDNELLLRISSNVCVLDVALLAYIIYKTECVYWYNGTEFKEAVEAGSERRKTFAWKHLKKFGGFAIIFLVYSVISYLLKIPSGADVAIAMVGMCVAAFSTIKIRL